MAGLLLLVRRRNPQRRPAGRDRLADPDGRLRACSPGCSSSPRTSTSRGGVTWFEKAVSAAYPLGDILLLGSRDPARRRQGQARAGVLPARREHRLASSPSDSAYTYALLTDAYNHQLIYDVGWIAYYLLWGAAALHPSMRTLEEPALDVSHAPDAAASRAARGSLSDRARHPLRPGRSTTPTSSCSSSRRRCSSCSSSAAWRVSSARRSGRRRASWRCAAPASSSSRQPAATRSTTPPSPRSSRLSERPPASASSS